MSLRLLISSVALLFCVLAHGQNIAVANLDSLINLSSLDEDLNGYCASHADSLNDYAVHLLDSFRNDYNYFAKYIQDCCFCTSHIIDSVTNNLINFQSFVEQEHEDIIKKQDFLHRCSREILEQEIGEIMKQEPAFQEVQIVLSDTPLYFNITSQSSPYITHKLLPFIENRRALILVKWAECKKESDINIPSTHALHH